MEKGDDGIYRLLRMVPPGKQVFYYSVKETEKDFENVEKEQISYHY